MHSDVKINGVEVPLISKERMLSTKGVYVVIGLNDPIHRNEAVDMLRKRNIQFDCLENYIVNDTKVYPSTLVKNSMVCYRDKWGNKFVYAGDKPYDLIINLQIIRTYKAMANNKVYVGKNFMCNIPATTYLRLRSSDNKIYIEIM